MKTKYLIITILSVAVTFGAIQIDRNIVTNDINTQMTKLVETNQIKSYNVDHDDTLTSTKYYVTVTHKDKNKGKYAREVVITRSAFSRTTFEIGLE